MVYLKRVALVVIVGSIAGIVGLVAVSDSLSQPPAAKYTAPAVPAGQTYTGAKRCSSCHFKEFTNWKKTKHATDAWSKVTAKYQRDPECLKCHVTGYGVKSGYAAGTDPQILANLVGVTCEACHGPGSKHEEDLPEVRHQEEALRRRGEGSQGLDLQVHARQRVRPLPHLAEPQRASEVRQVADAMCRTTFPVSADAKEKRACCARSAD